MSKQTPTNPPRGANEPLGINTRAVHGGETVDPVTGAATPNLVMSTTFALEEPAGFSIHAFDDEKPYIYTRWGNPTVEILERKLAGLEGAEECVAFGSGMAATAALLLTVLGAGDHLVISDVNYAGTAELAQTTLAKYGITATAVDTSDLAMVEAAIKPTTRMIWIETPANPILRLTDIAATAELARRHSLLLAVDSTFATPIATRPLELGADFVVHSLTKYIGGHGDALGGAVLGSAEQLAPLRSRALVHFGGVLSPFNAWLIIRGLVTLPVRMRAHEQCALQVAAFLEQHAAVTRVSYPGLESHPQHDLAARQMDNYSGMLSFQLRAGKDAAEALARRLPKELEVIHFAVSLGHHRSLIYWIDTAGMMEASLKLTGEQLARYREFAGDGVFRLSVGLEDAEDLCRDLDRVLGRG